MEIVPGTVCAGSPNMLTLTAWLGSPYLNAVELQDPKPAPPGSGEAMERRRLHGLPIPGKTTGYLHEVRGLFKNSVYFVKIPVYLIYWKKLW